GAQLERDVVRGDQRRLAPAHRVGLAQPVDGQHRPARADVVPAHRVSKEGSCTAVCGADGRSAPPVSALRQATVPSASGSGRGCQVVQASSASAQRGANGQPGKAVDSDGGAPGTGRGARSESRPGVQASRPRVEGWRGAVNSSAAGRSSTTRPAYITETRWQ